VGRSEITDLERALASIHFTRSCSGARNQSALYLAVPEDTYLSLFDTAEGRDLIVAEEIRFAGVPPRGRGDLSMDRLDVYKESVKRVISQYAGLKPSYGEVEAELVFDDERGHTSCCTPDGMATAGSTGRWCMSTCATIGCGSSMTESKTASLTSYWLRESAGAHRAGIPASAQASIQRLRRSVAEALPHHCRVPYGRWRAWRRWGSPT
jgi:hypothetical protein